MPHAFTTCPPNRGKTNSISIGSDQFFTLKRLKSNNGSGAMLCLIRDGQIFAFYTDSSFTNKVDPFSQDKVFAGPAIVQLRAVNEADYAELGLEISRAMYPPASIIRTEDGPMKVTLQESTDLSHWRMSTNGATHTLTNTSAKMFFRIKVEKVDEKK